MSVHSAGAEWVAELLTPLYRPNPWRPRLDPLDELIFTVLTQHTSDLNATRAYDDLRRSLPTWQQVAQAAPNTISKAIHHGGLAHVKALRIKQILNRIAELSGGLSLEIVADMPPESARKWLMQLPGVGIKTASVVLAFAFGMPLIPVDTHVHRVARRLGLIGSKITAEQAHYVLEEQVHPDARFVFHILLITHGRQLCKARRPLCTKCPLRKRCPAYSKSGLMWHGLDGSASFRTHAVASVTPNRSR